ncbi:hypothetical protein [Variovorax sp. HJSM1_2]|uniref:hypothetical protein n=1 Tax=Variovorax sp. HJSM1_2 TaxID=3366263 RepID=UPI003BD05BDE
MNTMQQVRICWLPSAVHPSAHIYSTPSYSGWEEETKESALNMRLLCNASNKLYGPGSHWIETRELMAAVDFIDHKAPPNAPVAKTRQQMNISIPQRLYLAAQWRLMLI